MSFLFHTVSVPVWVLIVMIGGLLPMLVQLFEVLYRLTQGGEVVKEEHSDMVVWKVRKVKSTAIPKHRPVDANRRKKKEEKADILQILRVISMKGEQGVLLQSITDNTEIEPVKLQPAMQSLLEKKFIDEVPGVNGKKYYLTLLGKKYCSSKGL